MMCYEYGENSPNYFQLINITSGEVVKNFSGGGSLNFNI